MWVAVMEHTMVKRLRQLHANIMAWTFRNQPKRCASNGIRAQCHNLQVPFPFPDGSFDSILGIEVFEHLFDPAYALSEMRRVLKPSGHIILSVPNIAHVQTVYERCSAVFRRAEHPVRQRTDSGADPAYSLFHSEVITSTDERTTSEVNRAVRRRFFAI